MPKLTRKEPLGNNHSSVSKFFVVKLVYSIIEIVIMIKESYLRYFSVWFNLSQSQNGCVVFYTECVMLQLYESYRCVISDTLSMLHKKKNENFLFDTPASSFIRKLLKLRILDKKVCQKWHIHFESVDISVEKISNLYLNCISKTLPKCTPSLIWSSINNGTAIATVWCASNLALLSKVRLDDMKMLHKYLNFVMKTYNSRYTIDI